jgi:hypothetical protein
MKNCESLLQVIFSFFAGNGKKDLGPDREVVDAGVPETGRAPLNQIHRRSKFKKKKILHCRCTVPVSKPEFVNV